MRKNYLKHLIPLMVIASLSSSTAFASTTSANQVLGQLGQSQTLQSTKSYNDIIGVSPTKPTLK